MVIEELHQRKEGVIVQRNIVIKNDDGREREETYYLVKCPHNKYFISFSEDGTSGFSFVSEEMMLHIINDEELSSLEALDIYAQTPQLNCRMD